MIWPVLEYGANQSISRASRASERRWLSLVKTSPFFEERVGPVNFAGISRLRASAIGVRIDYFVLEMARISRYRGRRVTSIGGGLHYTGPTR